MTAFADAMNHTLVGGNPQATNQPTNHANNQGKAWDMGNDMLVILTPDNNIAIGDPTPPGQVIGQFVPDDDDHGIIHWADGWDPVTLRGQLTKNSERLLLAQELCKHLMLTARWDAEVMADLLSDDSDKVDAAIVKLYDWLSGPPCTLCDIGKLPNESPLEYLAWVGKRIGYSAALKRLVNEDIEATIPAGVDDPGDMGHIERGDVED